MTLTGFLSESGIKAELDLRYTTLGSESVQTISGVGTEYLVVPRGGNACFVKGTSLGVLSSALEVKNPKSSEIGVWFEVKRSDSRFNYIASPNGAQNISETFSFSPIGWSKNAIYKGETTLRGTRVLKLSASSNLWVTGSGFGELSIFINANKLSLPLAISGPTGTSGLLYFGRWNSTKIIIPKARQGLPA
jgi:hypothetical protein